MNLESKIRIVALAEDVLARRVESLWGVRQLYRELSKVVDPSDADNDPLYQYFLYVDSETDDLALGPSRDLWSNDALAESDIAADKMRQDNQDEIDRACRDLIERVRRSLP